MQLKHTKKTCPS